MLGHRRFIDAVGFAWQVCEVETDPSNVIADRPPVPGWLYFFSRGTTLVLRDFPQDWDALSWKELEALRQRADVLGADAAMRVPVRLSGGVVPAVAPAAVRA